MRQLLVLFGAAALAAAQTVTFEAAAIKPPDPAYSGYGWGSTDGQIRVKNMTLRQLVMLAYDVKSYQVEGGPKWLDHDRWFIVARLPSGVKNDAHDGVMRLAMQSLLAERYQVAIHKESKSMPAYALTVAKGGPKLKEAEGTGSSSNSSGGKATFKGVNMEHLIGYLARILERPIADETGLTGRYDFTLEWTREEGPDFGTSLMSALQEQAGLKLEGRKAPVEIIVIDKAEKPSEN